MRKAHQIAIVAVGALVLAGFVAVRLLRPKTPGEVATAVLDAYERRDGHALFELAPPEERTLYALDERKVQALLDRVGFGSKVAPDGRRMQQDNADMGSSTVSRWYRLPTGERGLFDVTAMLREKHRVLAWMPITTLIYSHLYVAGRSSGATDKPLVFLKGIQAESRPLNALGFNGVIDQKNLDDPHLTSWSDLEGQFEVRYQKFLANRASRKSPSSSLQGVGQ